MKCIFFCIVSSLFIQHYINGQNTTADTYRIKLEAFRAMHPPAMIYFHFDKPYYYKGDSVHFKVYQIETEEWKPRATPQFVDIDIVRLSDGKIVQKEKTIVDNGVGIGAFLLSKEYLPGNYQFKADSHLLNFNAKDIDFQYDFKIEEDYEAKVKIDSNANCYVEGGSLVLGVLSHIVVKASSDQIGKLVNSNGDSLASVPITYGFSSFKYRPKTTEQLYVQLDGKLFPLPEVKKYGTAMTIDFQPNDANVAIILSSKFAPGLSEKRMTLMCDHDGKTGLYFDVVAQTGKVIQIFPKAALRHGINRFLLIDSSMNILNERLFYYHNPRLMYIHADKNIVTDGINDEITISLHVENKEGLPIDADLSISAIDSSVQNNAIDRDNIVQTFTIQQYLSKRIPHLENLFDGTKLTDNRMMDLQMICAKYGRYQWPDVRNYEYKALEPFRVPYADERMEQKMKAFSATNGLYYWNPTIPLENGKAKINFKVPKGTKLHYKITGFDRKGLIGHLEF